MLSLRLPLVTFDAATQVRGKLYELLANCIPPELILRMLLLALLSKLDDELKLVSGGRDDWCTASSAVK